MSDELKPCPFCGGEAQVMIESSYYMGGCPNEGCGAGGLMHVERDAAIAAWNRRAEYAALDARYAALVQAAEMFLATLDDERGFDPYAAEERKEQLRAALERAKGE